MKFQCEGVSYGLSQVEEEKYIEILPHSTIPSYVDAENLILWLVDEGWTPPSHLKTGVASPSTEISNHKLNFLKKRSKKMRINCTVWSYNADEEMFPVAFTKTYWGAKRIVRRFKKIKPDRTFQIHESWNIPRKHLWASYYGRPTPPSF